MRAVVWAFCALSWLAFLELAAMARQTLEQGIVGDAKMQRVFAAIRLLGGSLTTAALFPVVRHVSRIAAGAAVADHRVRYRSAARPGVYST
jgi:hypothetical protein